MAQDKVYSVTLGTTSRLNIIDASTGRVLNNIQIQGEIVNGPIVVGDKCTLVTRNSNSTRRGYIYSLPTGRLHNTFHV